MKSLLLTITICFTFFATAFAMETASVIDKKEEKKLEVYCPTTLISDNTRCMDCHKMRRNESGQPYFGLKEVTPNDSYGIYSTRGLDILTSCQGNLYPYYTMTDIDAGQFKGRMDFIRAHPELGKQIVIEIYSPGGSLMEAWKIISVISEHRAMGYEFTTRVDAFAASAGFLVACAGDIGKRLVNPHAQLMWHELWQIAFLKIETPSSKEDEAEILRSLQTNIHDWLVSRCRKPIKIEQLDKMVHKKDWWVTGKQMHEFGFADGFIGQKVADIE